MFYVERTKTTNDTIRRYPVDDAPVTNSIFPGTMLSNCKKTQHTRDEPREHHYVFAYNTLRELCAQDPLKFFTIVTSPEQPKLLARLWALTAVRVGKPIVNINPAQLSVTTGSVMGSPAVIFKMPRPEAISEAHFVAVLLTNSPVPEGEARQAQFRYFTLEERGNSEGTFLCEWGEDERHNFGDGPAATIEDFIGAVERKIAQEMPDSESP